MDKQKVFEVFNNTYEHLMSDFNADQHAALTSTIHDNLASFMESEAFVGGPGSPACAGGAASPALPRRISAAPCGPTARLFGMDAAKLVDKLSKSASGAAGAQAGLPAMLALQAITTGAGLLQTVMSTAVQIVPRFFPPFMPLPCMPMVTGTNCLGAIQHPITTADFVSAPQTDAALDGVIAGFPTLYARKVGSTSDAAYKTCFSAYMGMHCASAFPRCATPQAAQSPSPIGRLPMCFTHCLATLIACPGMWLEDIMGECMTVSVPPMCSVSIFANYWLLPPQYASDEAAGAADSSCPSVPASLQGMEPLNVYEEEVPESPDRKSVV